MTNKIKIYLIEPNDKSKYDSYLVYAGSEADARFTASCAINIAKEMLPGTDTPLIDDIFRDEKLSKCKEIEFELLPESCERFVKIRYNDVEYSLVKDHAKRV